ncbi:phage tail length tape measure family protein [Bradyrhizobium sp. URHD0069]|uniref:phage tail length tape measure family protein n=1 Tax=Bradyrhizobium sp. URHD0069 TaxID=1380355 RepID=UPI000496EAF0|nr:phage tail length tape measure family protein [Bradyrhizobium sp. URHD0069]
MADDVAKLGLEVDSKGLEQGTDKLKEFSDTAKEAGDNADKASSKFVGLGSSASDMGGKFKQASDGAEKIVSGIGKASETAKKVVDATSNAAAAAAKVVGSFNKTFAETDTVTRATQSAADRAGISFKEMEARVAGASGAVSESDAAASAANISYLRAVGAVTLLGVAAAAAAVGAGVLAYQWLTAQTAIDQALIGIGRRTGTTISDINKFASANATATGLSVSQARDAAIEFTKTGNIAVDQLKGLGDAVYGFSVLTGKDAAEATKTLAAALSGDLVKGAQDLDKIYGTLDGRTLQYISTLQATGERQEAQKIILKAIEEQNKKAADSVDILTKAYNFLANQLDATANQLGKSLTFSLPGDRRSPLEVESEKNQSQFASDSRGGDDAVRQLLPQIGAYEKLIKLQDDLNKARESAGAQGLGGFNDAAATAIQNQLALTKEAMAETVNYNNEIARVREEWAGTGVSIKAALQLEALQDQLAIVRATSESERQAAQYAAAYSAAKRASMSDVDAEQIAADKMALSEANATKAVMDRVQSLRDSTAMIRAHQNGTEATTAAAIAYKNAIAGGATETAAAALRSETLRNNLAKSADYAHQFEQSMVRAANAADSAQDSINQASQDMQDAAAAAPGGSGSFDVPKGTQYTSSWDPLGYRGRQEVNQTSDQAAAMGLPNGLDAAIKNVQQQPTGDLRGGGSYAATDQSMISTLQSLYELKNAQTNDNGVKRANITEEIAWLNTLPETIARNQQIVTLTQSLDSLKDSVDASTQATLNPLYQQGHGAMPQIGYYHAATGLDGIVQGPSGVDKVPVHMMLTAGEHIQVTPAGQSNDNRSSRTTNLTQNIVVSGSDTPQRRRNAMQRAQGFVSAAG